MSSPPTRSRSAGGCWKLEAVAPAPVIDALSDAIADWVEAVTLFPTAADHVRLAAFTTAEPDHGALRAAAATAAPGVSVELTWLPQRDWLAENRASFPPIAVGRFFVHPTHYDGAVPAGARALAIDAAAAFGTGAHGSTQGCLAALGTLAKTAPLRDRWPVLDVGCGTGVLALAAAGLARRRVIAGDIDRQAVHIAAANARRNHLHPWLTAVTAPGLRHPAIARAAPYGLVLANILARPLAALAPTIAAHLRPGGHVILSGLLATQERLVLTAYAPHGLHLHHRIDIGEWRTLVLRVRA